MLNSKKTLSALFYGIASFMITIVNKTILTTYGFPSFQVLGLSQMFTTIVFLFLAKKIRLVNFPNLQQNTFKKIFPLPLIYMGNVFFGLGGTKELSLPMFIALRRVAILMTMVLEIYLLKVKPSFKVQFSVYTMVLGATVAAVNDLSFNLQGYFFIFLNNFFSASYYVFLKRKLDSKDLGEYGLMYYNSLFMIGPTLLLAVYSGNLENAYNYQHWNNFPFLCQFLSSCTMGFFLNYSMVLCTSYNSSLTTTIIGSLKNIFITYLGMFIAGDYIFSWSNFLGINISVVGSLTYSYVTFRK
ncbi:UDP-sugar transporter UST74c-like [Leptinotarsa decemlineata]|uniref:UDP-sugar transporter UST74c-like n=1 Tax=Leptinotarsa decemlineata TaxID=7539 RepID=UPI003D308E10